MVEKSPALIWKTKDKELKIKTLKELFDVLVNIKQDGIEKEIIINLKENKLLKWLETNFPKQMEIATHLNNIQEFTPQQVRERLLRDLRKII